MIPTDYITEWRTLGPAPWPSDAQVEQDLLLSRAIVALYSEPEVATALAFRGGTALRDIAALVEHGALVRSAAGGRSTHYVLAGEGVTPGMEQFAPEPGPGRER